MYGNKSKKNIIEQAEWNQNSLQEIISDITGRNFPMRSVVVFPGWWVEDKKNHAADAPWVLNPEAFPKFHENSKDVISTEDYKLITNQLKKHIRKEQEKKKKKLKKIL